MRVYVYTYLHGYIIMPIDMYSPGSAGRPMVLRGRPVPGVGTVVLLPDGGVSGEEEGGEGTRLRGLVEPSDGRDGTVLGRVLNKSDNTYYILLT